MLTFAHIPTGPTTSGNRFISGRKGDNLSSVTTRITRIQASRPRRDSLLTLPFRCPNSGGHLRWLAGGLFSQLWIGAVAVGAEERSRRDGAPQRGDDLLVAAFFQDNLDQAADTIQRRDDGHLFG